MRAVLDPYPPRGHRNLRPCCDHRPRPGGGRGDAGGAAGADRRGQPGRRVRSIDRHRGGTGIMTARTLAVFAKEALDAVRDRRSLTSALSFALFGPLVLAMALAAIAKSRDDDGPLRLTVAGAGHAPSLIHYLEQNGVEVVRATADVEPAVRRGDLKLALVIPESYGKDFRASRPARVDLVHDASRMGSSSLVRRVERLLNRY